jgi:ribosomal protein L12E/L44/L45/RPP1/RPP2
MGFVATADCIAELERVLRIESHMMRFLTVRLLEDVSLEERQLAATNRTAVMTADSADEEEERDRDRRPRRDSSRRSDDDDDNESDDSDDDHDD